jgi:hypothetical protein
MRAGVWHTGIVELAAENANIFFCSIYALKGKSCKGDYVEEEFPRGIRLRVGSTSLPPFTADAILFVLDTATGQEINRGLILGSGSTLLSGGALRFDAAFNLYDGFNMSDANSGRISLSLSKWTSLVTGCERPTGVTAGSITSNSARISWAAVTEAVSYSLQYRQAGGNCGQGANLDN